MKMPPSFPSPAVWNVSSEVNTRSRDTFLQPICSYKGEGGSLDTWAWYLFVLPPSLIPCSKLSEPPPQTSLQLVEAHL